MGVRDWIKKLWGRDKDLLSKKEAKGSSEIAQHSIGSTDIGVSPTKMSDGIVFIGRDIMVRYSDYENMDDYPDTSIALDRYTDNSTIPDSVHGKTIWAKTRDGIVRDIIDDCLHRRLRIEEDIWPAVRNMCKYGDLYGEILVNETGVIGINWLPSPTVRRVVDDKGNLLGFVQDTTGKFAFNYKEVFLKKNSYSNEELRKNGLIFFEPWEVVHWRLRSKNIRSQYGVSILDSARYVWKRLVLMEDTALVQKLLRAPGRFAFYIDVAGLAPRKAREKIKRMKREFKKQRLIDSSGKLDARYNPLSPFEDFWIGLGENENTRVEVIAGPDVQMMDDVEYFQDKLNRYLKMPKEDDNERALAHRDAQFARVCMRIQREFISGMRKVMRLHLAALNIDPDSVVWKLGMSVPSSIFEMQQIEIMNAQVALASSMSEWVSRKWILEHVMHFTQDDASFEIGEKNNEDDANAKVEAGTQADIMKMYPQLQQMQAQGELSQMESVMKELSGFKKILDGVNSNMKNIPKLLESNQLMESKINRMNRDNRRARNKKSPDLSLPIPDRKFKIKRQSEDEME